MKVLGQKEIDELLERGGEGLNLKETTIEKVSFFRKDLSNSRFDKATLREVGFYECFLPHSKFVQAHLHSVNFFECVMPGMCAQDVAVFTGRFFGCAMSYSFFEKAHLYKTAFNKCILEGANFRNMNLEYTTLDGCILDGADLDYSINVPRNVEDMFNIIPKGAHTGWKVSSEGRIVELEIPESARRTCGTGRMCRASSAKVIKIENPDRTESYDEAHSHHSPTFVYRVGKTVFPSFFEENRWVDCSGGIHYFLTRKEALHWKTMLL